MNAPESTARNRIEDMYPLSPMQQGLLFHSLLAPGSGLYMPHIVIDLSGDVDSARLRSAWEAVVTAQPVLRSGFFWEQRDEPFQVVSRSVSLHWTEQDWRALSPAEQSGRLDSFVAASRSQPFDLHRPPLMRLGLIRRGDDSYTLIWAYHHLVLDGWSAARVLEQVFGRLIAAQRGIAFAPEAPGAPYSSYIAWLRRQDRTSSEAFWRAHLHAPAEITTIPLPAPVDPTRDAASGHREITLGSSETQALQAFARAQQITLNTLMQGAFALLLARYNDAREVTFGNTVAGRPTDLPGAASMIGLFINTLPVQVSVPARMPVADWLRSLQQRQAQTVPHEHVALRDLQEWTNEGRALFECLFVFESYPVPDLPGDSTGGLRLDGVSFDEQTHFPLTLQIADGDALRLAARFDGRRYADADIERLLAHLSGLVMAMATAADTALHELSVLTATERTLLADWNRTEATLPAHENLADWLEAQADTSPQQTALIFNEETFSYRALHDRANRLAHLLTARGIGAESIVAVHMPRSPQMVVAILATLKAGAAYLPLAPDQPGARLRAMLDDAQASLLLTAGDDPLPTDIASVNVESIDLSTAELDAYPADNPVRTLHGDNATYVIYTSGSTGRPKGVVNTHRALINRLAWMQQRYRLNTDDRVLHKTPLGFDVSAWELLWPLVCGATLVLAEPDRHRDGAYLAALIDEAAITTIHFVPPMLSAFLDAVSTAGCRPLKRVICSGEALSPALQQRFFERLPDTELHNLYGPTEAAIDVTAWQCGPETHAAGVPIGRPIDNIRIHLLDGDLRPVPPGIPGELYIGGIGLARGYLGNPALTAGAFVPDPMIPDPSETERSTAAPLLYRSGDLARWHADGTLEYLGRRDHQVKLRGVRIELGEIESALHEHPDVGEARVLLREDNGTPQLVAYLVASAGQSDHLDAVSDTDWHEFLESRLPSVMIPAAFVVIDALPLNVNGKVDRQRLPSPAAARAVSHVAPRNPTEETVAAVWSEVLKVDRIGAHDNFLALGGHSLNATRVNTRLRRQLDVDLPLHAHFRYPALEDLATHIDALRMAGDAPQAHADPTERTGDTAAERHIEIEI